MSAKDILKVKRIDYSDLYYDTFTSNTIDKEFFLKTFLSFSPEIFRKGWSVGKIFGSVISPGHKLLGFKILDVNDIEIILAADTKTIDYRLALAFVNSIEDKYIAVLSTIVCFKNVFGRIYFYLIKPLHKFFFKQMFAKTINMLDNNRE